MSPVLRADPRAGVVYTPPDVARPMVELALAPLVRDKSARALGELRICDPAVGEGAFLVEARAVLADAFAAAWRAEGTPGTPADAAAAASRCLVGCDVDADALGLAREALGCELRLADALELDWREAFPAVFARGGFDVVLGNPPYIRQERLAVHKPGLQRFASYDGVADLYVYFLELAHQLLRPGGRYCLVTPNKWLTCAYGRPLRRFLSGACSVEGVVDLGRLPLFADADAFPCIVWGTAGQPRTDPIRATRVTGGGVGPALASGVPHARERWHDEPWHIDTPADRALIDRLEQAWPRLGDLVAARPARGVVTGCNRAFVIDGATREALLADDPAAAALIHPFVKGRDIRRWEAAPPQRWILLVGRDTSLDAHPGVLAHLARFRRELEPRPAEHHGAWPGRKPGTYRWYELQDPVGPLVAARAPRLLYQDIQTQPACALDEGGLVPDTTVWILPTADPFLLAVLNSSLYGWYARRRFPPALNGAVRPKLPYLRALPVATPSPERRAGVVRLVEDRRGLEPARRAGDPGAARRARELDLALDACVLDAYELTPAERRLLA